MRPHNPTTFPKRIFRGTVWSVIPLVAALIMALGMITPIAAQPSSDANLWGEICGQSPSQGGQQTPFHDCDHCDLCAVRIGGLAFVFGAQPRLVGQTQYALISYSPVVVCKPMQAEQHWATPRGPPLASEDKTMTDYYSFAIKEPAKAILKQGATPWI